VYRISNELLGRTFHDLRSCGEGKRECQVVWISPWRSSDLISQVVHTSHTASGAGFTVVEPWLTSLWQRLAAEGVGVRVQVHTHPGRAFHSHTDDHWPIIHTPGFLSLVIPNFGMGSVGFEGAYLAKLGGDGRWYEADIGAIIEVVR